MHLGTIATKRKAQNRGGKVANGDEEGSVDEDMNHEWQLVTTIIIPVTIKLILVRSATRNPLHRVTGSVTQPKYSLAKINRSQLDPI